MRKPWAVVVVVVSMLVVGATTMAAAKPPSGTGRQIVERTVTPEPNFDMVHLNEVVTCPAGTASVNGGWAWVTPPVNETTARRVAGGPEDTSWRVVSGPGPIFVDPDGPPQSFILWAICVNA
jgi:hypothetical protein